MAQTLLFIGEAFLVKNGSNSEKPVTTIDVSCKPSIEPPNPFLGIDTDSRDFTKAINNPKTAKIKKIRYLILSLIILYPKTTLSSHVEDVQIIPLEYFLRQYIPRP